MEIIKTGVAPCAAVGIVDDGGSGSGSSVCYSKNVCYSKRSRCYFLLFSN